MIEKTLRTIRLEKGDRVSLTAVPGAGLRCQVAGKADESIGNPAFARAIWDIYLGRRTVSDAVKSGLVSRR
jgi:hypothetical protein